MSIFAPVYPPTRGQHTFLANKQKADRKRKREAEEAHSSDDEAPAKPSEKPEARPARAFQHSISRTDPYHVAGYSRAEQLPPAPFPHAPIKDRNEQRPSVEEELAALNPPLFLPKPAVEKDTSSLKRRHVENLNTLLHTCMLRGDWNRASRAWALLLRTEIGGHGLDLRREGRWEIGGELLMRRKADAPATQASGGGDDNDGGVRREFSDAAFRAARDYYERLILQYPHTPRTQYNVNAVAFYPALFNVWVYEVQDRARRRRGQAEAERPVSSSGSEHSASSPAGAGSRSERLDGIRRQELEEALPIARRMDELLVSPPYDSSVALLHLRGMIGLWLAGLYAEMFGAAQTAETEGSEHGSSSPGVVGRDSGQANAERKKAVMYLRRAEKAGIEIPGSITTMFDAVDDKS